MPIKFLFALELLQLDHQLISVSFMVRDLLFELDNSLLDLPLLLEVVVDELVQVYYTAAVFI